MNLAQLKPAKEYKTEKELLAAIEEVTKQLKSDETHYWLGGAIVALAQEWGWSWEEARAKVIALQDRPR
ncbi:MAG: hypothetical protein F6J93_31280 [Oscillatoria sp. SIO1A7]|nr:hypothetical protein [Oscillatoria sp. SIO1A7]